jgi:FkbM family methyltransferase
MIPMKLSGLSVGLLLARSRKAARLVGALAYIKAARLAGDQPPIYLDVGARGGLPPTWRLARKFGLIQPAYCEPDAAEAERLTTADPSAIIIPYAFGQVTESRTLYITHEPGRSSLLFPECPSFIENGRGDWSVEREILVQVVRLNDVWSRFASCPPTFIKVDVQGFELEVLKGAEKLFDNDILCVELESSFIPFYKGQPTFQTVFDFMSMNKFDLVKIKPQGLFDNGILEFNAFFVRRGHHKDGLARLWKLINNVPNHERLVTYGY